MKKRIIVFVFILLLLVLFSIIFQVNNGMKSYNDITYLKDIYTAIGNEEFFVGNVDANTVVLKNREFDVIKKIEFNSKGKIIKTKSILMQNDQVYFILNGSVDDSNGIVFCKSSSINMEGLHKLIRIGGNAYYFQTNSD